jgi:hypothetical protein
MIEGDLMKRYAGTIFVFAASFLAACTPLYTSDTNITGTPKPQSFDVAERVASLGLIAPVSLQGLAPLLSNALKTALEEAHPPIRAISFQETGNLLNDRGLAADYADLVSGFVRSGVLEHKRLARIGGALGSRYVLLPGLAEFDQEVIDRFEAMGVKVVRNRVTTLHVWLQLWDSRTGHNLWESAGEVTVVTALLSAKRAVPLDAIAQNLWLRMIQDELLGGQTTLRIFRN